MSAGLKKPDVVRGVGLGAEVLVALERFGVDALEVSKAPALGLMLGEAEGGLEAVLKTARFSRDQEVVRFLEVYDGATETEKTLIPWEAFALKAGVDALHFLGAVMTVMRECSANIVKILAVSNHPGTVRARIESAKVLGREGVRDRDALDKAMRFLPAASKGPTIMFKVGSDAAEVSLPDDGGEDSDADPDIVFPSLTETQKLLEE